MHKIAPAQHKRALLLHCDTSQLQNNRLELMISPLRYKPHFLVPTVVWHYPEKCMQIKNYNSYAYVQCTPHYSPKQFDSTITCKSCSTLPSSSSSIFIKSTSLIVGGRWKSRRFHRCLQKRSCFALSTIACYSNILSVVESSCCLAFGNQLG